MNQDSEILQPVIESQPQQPTENTSLIPQPELTLK